ncbi:MAG: SDR family NAD(P)-dependent oxidoreductase [Desulfobacterales bacterium]|nr:SDR family NAD(P)-dependent oxidoreductase [Desulfobacterales bacterium]
MDAACASSLSAVHLGLLELESGRSDMVVTGGVDTLNDIFMHMCFSKTGTLSATGDARPFSKDADGTVLGEGIGMLVLKRLEKAESDGDRIYAVIKGLGSSSDGKSQSIYAPRSQGQARALRAAYRNAGISPADVQLIEAHGTGTRVGDKVEFEALNQVFEELGANGNKCALGSVKSMIGHTKASAGAAGLIKAALGLYHKVLPPTLKAESPDPALDINNSHFYLNTISRPWLSNNGTPRRAGVSAFGFGGSNFHVVLEEYNSNKNEASWDGSVEIIAFSAASPDALAETAAKFIQAIESGISDRQFGIAAAESRQRFSTDHAHRLLIVGGQPGECKDRLKRAREILESGTLPVEQNRNGIYLGGPQAPGKLAFIFPGQGSQYPGMGRDIVCTFPAALEALQAADKRSKSKERLSDLIFPPPAYDPQHRLSQETQLRRTDNAQPGIGAISLAMLKVLREFEIEPDAVCGHSFGELTALCAAGWIGENAFLDLAALRGQLMAAAGGDQDSPQGAMLAVQAPLDEIETLLADSKRNIVLANRNSPAQGVLSGATADIREIEQICKSRNFGVVRLPVSAAFHSQQLKGAVQPFFKALQKVLIDPSAIDVFSNTTAVSYPVDPESARNLLSQQLVHPVNFAGEIDQMYEAGIRTFVEIGPKAVLTGLISANLQDRQFEAIAMDGSKGKANGISDLAHLLCRLAALGYPLKLTNWENPSPLARKSRMQVFLNGANYVNPNDQKTEDRSHRTEDRNQRTEDRNQRTEDRGQKTEDRGQTAEDRGRWREYRRQRTENSEQIAALTPIVGLATPKPEKYETMSKENNNTSESIHDAYRMVTEGLKAMQRLQSQTAEVHQKFLETQAEANRSLQEMIKHTQNLAGPSSIVSPAIRHSETPLGSTPPSATAVTAAGPVPDVTGISAAPTRYEPSAAEEIQPTLDYLNQSGQGQTHDVRADAATATEASPDSLKQPEINSNRDTAIESTMLEVVSQLTGYPIEMLGMDMDIEAELGIDSIKRVEILSSLEEKLPDLPAVSPDVMGSLKTLGQIVQFLSGSGPAPSETVESEQSSPVKSAAPVSDSMASNTAYGRDLTTAMLGVVSRLTGYPIEMLGMDMDIEAELGIDSIKRVEILSTLEEEMPGLPAVSPEVMGTLKTLGQIADYFTNTRTENETSESSGDDPSQATSVSAKENLGTVITMATATDDSNMSALPRNIVTIADAPPISGNTVTVSSSKKVFVTEDSSGLSEEITEELSRLNIKTVKISLDILKYRKQLPEAAGLIIVQNPASEKMHQDLEDAFRLSKHLAPDLTAAALENGAVFATVTRLDGAFGLKRHHLRKPVQAGLAGLAKTAALEWENVCCHAIDIASEWTDNRAVASAVVREVLSRGTVEIGLDLNSRISPVMVDASLSAGEINLDAEDVVVISGGARGVTAAAALELARHTGCKMVLLGRSPEPMPEPSWMSDLGSEPDIKKAIIENEFHGQQVSLPEIDKAFRRYASNREITDNLNQLRATGSMITYYSADVRDYDNTRSIINRIRSDIGPVSAIIHGAGVLEDRLITDKTVEQFRRVYDTKVKGLDNLLRATREDNLKYLVCFSSVAARMGNRGQVDYAMANEVLNKVALQESIKRPDCRVKSINWGPWDGGMVTAPLKREFERKGIFLMPIDTGAKAMLREMTDQRTGPIEVVIGAELPTTTAARKENLPTRPELVKPASVPHKSQLSLAFEREIDIQRYPILQSHVIDGKPVVPLALMIEWLVHGALHENPGLILLGLDDVRVMKGIRLKRPKAHIKLLAGRARKVNGRYEVEVAVRDATADGRDITHARATAILGDSRDAAPEYQFSKTMVARAYPRNMEEVYARILFHGPQLQGLKKIVSCSARGMVAHISRAPAPKEWMTAPLRNQWIADPLALDCAFQMATVWCFEEKGLVSLPSFTASYRQYCDRFPVDGVTVVLEVTAAERRKMQGNFTFLDSNDKIIAGLKGYEAIMDAALLKAFKPQYRASA